MTRLDLARSAAFPDGSAAHSYLLRLPLDPNDRVDAAALRAEPARATVLRVWPDEPERHGYLRHGRKGWVFSYAPGEADDEAVFHLETHPIRVGAYLTITEQDGTSLGFKVASCTNLPDG